jgi:hypothetical protein
MIYILRHEFYGCDTGCCGSALYKQGEAERLDFSFYEPDNKDIVNNEVLLNFCKKNFLERKFHKDDLVTIEYYRLNWCYLQSRQIDD